MITFIEGSFEEVEPTHVVVDTGGVGYHLNISLQTFAAIKSLEGGRLHTYMHVKEDSQTLYGFYTTEERRVFMHLISINGVGPSTGLMIQSSLNAKELFAAIVHEDVTTIQSVKGIGGKTAQRIVLELKDKLRKEGLGVEIEENAPASSNSLRNEALSALLTLGITKTIAEKSVDKILKDSGDQVTLEELIKMALKNT